MKPPIRRVLLVRAWLYASCLPAIGCGSDGASERLGAKQERIIYGADERIEYGAMSAVQQIRARSVAIHLKSSGLSCSGATCTLTTEPFEHDLGGTSRLCQGTKFLGQAQIPEEFGNCTGWLVAPNLLATAGHCFGPSDLAGQCAITRYVFGFTAAADGSNVVTSVPSSDVYSCSSILVRSFPPDYALVRLDRSVTNRIPFIVRHGGKIADAQQLETYGYPWLLPLKLSQNASVKNNLDPSMFFTNTDTFPGNSGGPVLNSATGLAEGIVSQPPISNDVVWTFDGQGPCLAYNVCPDDTGCSDSPAQPFVGMTRITEAVGIPPHAALITAVL
jgi:hypothetical protein